VTSPVVLLVCPSPPYSLAARVTNWTAVTLRLTGGGGSPM
jgi:hypothetical protein